jgi:hypothetical protein
MTTAFIADLFGQGVRLQPHEAVAIVQLLIHGSSAPADVTEASGPPCPANVRLSTDGSVACVGCDVTPSVFEMAVLLETLLPAGTARVPGGLRYAIARGLLDVDAPPFDSIEDFSRALARFEKGSREDAVRGVLARAAANAPLLLTDAAQPTTHATQPANPVPQPRLVASQQPRLVASQQPHPVSQQPRAVAAPVAPAVDASLRSARTAAYLRLARRMPRSEAPVVQVPHFEPAAPRPRWQMPALAAALAGAIALGGVADLVRLRNSRLAGGTTALREAQGTASSSRLEGVPDAAQASGPAAHGGASSSIATSTPGEPRDDNKEPSSRESAARANTPARTEVAQSVRRTRNDVTASRTASAPVAAAAESEGVVVRALDDRRRPVFSPAFASSGTAMFFHTGGTRDARSALAMAAAPDGGGDLAVMTIVDDGARNYHVQPSPDGRFIAFDSDRDGERGVYIARSDGTNVRRISGDGYAAVPTWAPDSGRVTYVRAEKDNPKVWNLWLQTLDEGEARRLTQYRYGQTWSASWFPDNRRVAYTHEDAVVVLDVATGQRRTFASPVKGRLVRTPAVSPDGTRIIFQVYRTGAWLLDLADGSMRCVLTDPTAEEFAWAPDGRRVAFHSRRDGQWGIYILHRS